MEATYLGDIELTDETLAHYGVKGMKWKNHKPKAGANASAAYKQIDAMDDDEYRRLLSRIKLTKGGKGGSKSASSKEKGGSEKSSGSGKAASEKKETSKSEKGVTEKETKPTTQQATNEKTVYKTKVDPEYTKYLENKLTKANQSKLDQDQIKERIAVSDAKKKRLSMGIRRLYSRR